MSSQQQPQLVDRAAKRHLLLVLYGALDSREMFYSDIHSATKKFQDMLEKNYGITLGYSFNDVSIYPEWSNKLQQDIQRWGSLDVVIENKEELLPGGHMKVRPALTDTGYFLVETNARYSLEKLLGKGSLERLKRDAEICVSKQLL